VKLPDELVEYNPNKTYTADAMNGVIANEVRIKVVDLLRAEDHTLSIVGALRILILCPG
jgi:hypothetical protein